MNDLSITWYLTQHEYPLYPPIIHSVCRSFLNVQNLLLFNNISIEASMHGGIKHRLFLQIATNKLSIILSPSYTNHFSSSTFFPIQLATTGVRATVGGNLMGDAALWAA